MLSDKEDSYYYKFLNLWCDLTGDRTRDLPHLRWRLYNYTTDAKMEPLIDSSCCYGGGKVMSNRLAYRILHISFSSEDLHDASAA